MTETEIMGLIISTLLAAIIIAGLAVDAWMSWRDGQRHKRLLRHMDNRSRDKWDMRG